MPEEGPVPQGPTEAGKLICWRPLEKQGSPLADGREVNHLRAVVMAMAGESNHRRAG